MSPQEILAELENLNISDVDQAIAIKRDELSMLERLRAVLAGEPVKSRKPRGAKPSPPPTESPDRESRPDAAASIPLMTRVQAFLEVSGPSLFRSIQQGVGCHPRDLKPVLASHHFSYNEVERTYTLLRHR